MSEKFNLNFLCSEKTTVYKTDDWSFTAPSGGYYNDFKYAGDLIYKFVDIFKNKKIIVCKEHESFFEPIVGDFVKVNNSVYNVVGSATTLCNTKIRISSAIELYKEGQLSIVLRENEAFFPPHRSDT
jgi:hypothetical protein